MNSRNYSCVLRSRFQYAFSLIEVLVCIAVISILFSISIPSFSSLLNKSHTEQLLASYVSVINLARQTAINKNVMVTLCGSEDGLSCKGEWQTGSIAFIDYNSNAEVDDEDVLLRRINPDKYISRIYWRSFRNKKYLQITSLGFTNYQSGNFTFCSSDKDLKQARQLIINRMARIRPARDSDRDGIFEDSRGRPLRC